jgi:hypothetical protein
MEASCPPLKKFKILPKVKIVSSSALAQIRIVFLLFCLQWPSKRLFSHSLLFTVPIGPDRALSPPPSHGYETIIHMTLQT